MEDIRGTLRFNDDKTDLDLLSSFKSAFPDITKIKTEEQLRKAISLSPVILEWYTEYKDARSAFKQRPVWMGDSLQGAKDWELLREQLEAQTEKKRAWTNRIDAVALELKKTTESVRREKEDYYKNLSPLLMIDAVTVNQLPLSSIEGIVACESEEEQKQYQAEQVLEFKKKLYNEYCEKGTVTNPFVKR